MEYKLKSVKESILDVDKSEGIVKTYINTFNVIDTYKEVSMPGSFKKNFSESLKKIYWLKNHDWNQMPGVTKELYEDARGAVAVGQINMKKQLGVDLWNDYLLFAEHGRSLEHSIRTKAIKYSIEKDVMYIQEQKIDEWSTLTRPGANPQTEVITLKSAEEDIEMLRAALKLDYSDEKLKSIEEKLNALETLIKEAALSTPQVKPLPTSEVINIINRINNLNF